MRSRDQQRVQDIRGFRSEVTRLAADGILRLDEETAARIRAHQDAVLASLGRRRSAPSTVVDEQLSTGMRIAMLLGAAALSAAYGFFVFSVWNGLGAVTRIALVTIPALLLAVATDVAARRETTGYLASIAATVAVIAFWIDLASVGTLFNLPDSRHILLAAGVFALVLAYSYRLALPLQLGIVAVGGWFWSLDALPLGLWWRTGFNWFDPLILVGLAAMLLPAVLRQPEGFGQFWRGWGAGGLVLGLLVVGESGRASLLGQTHPSTVEGVYQVIEFLVYPLLIAIGIRRGWREWTVIGTVGLIFFLLFRLVGWFWDLLPRWLFFFLVGLLAVLVLLLLRQIRMRKEAAA